MTDDPSMRLTSEVLADLRQRCLKAANNLEVMHREAKTSRERIRLEGKRQGVELAASYIYDELRIRGYA